MAARRIEPIVEQLCKAVQRSDDAHRTDGRLLERFVTDRDPAAFETLVRRHGPMVLGVCRRLVGDAHDADDCFQATFLVLATKAESVWPRERVGNWLYGVAHTTAVRVRAANAKRRLRERQVTAMPEPPTMPQEPGDDLHAVLDDELARLPDKYRTAVVLCDLEGRPRKEVARQFQIPEGTLSSRLTTARKLLARRLARRGLAVAGSLAVVLSENAATARVPASLVKSTVEAASAAGPAAAAALVSARVVALKEGVLKTMLIKKLQAVLTVLALALLVGGAGLLYRGHAAEPARARPAPDDDERPAGKLASSASSIRLLSSRPLPHQALVGLEKGQLVVRTLDVMYEPRVVEFEGKTHTGYQKAEILRTMQFDLSMVKVYDVHGKTVPRKDLSGLLQEETVALVSSDAQAADPLNLRLFREGTLLFILPAPSPPRPAPYSAVPAMPAPTVSEPPPAVYYIPATPRPATEVPPPPRPSSLKRGN